MKNQIHDQKFIVLFLIGVLSAGIAAAVPFESRRFTPYFNMKMAQGGYLGSSGGFFTGAQINMRVGVLSRIAEKHSILSLYSLDFSGQGFRFPDTQEFGSKNIGHDFNFEYRWDASEHWRLRPGLAFGKTLTQTAAGEIWGEGLYDNRSSGGQLGADYKFGLSGRSAKLSFDWLYRDIRFPNYSDIIREFQGASANSELAGGLKDQILNEIALSFYRQPFFTRIRYDRLQFKNERRVEASGTYGATQQADNSLTLNTNLEQKVWVFEAAPELGYQMYRSNQNFLLFQSATDPAPQFAENYYDYNEVQFSFPLFINFASKWALNLGVTERYRHYLSRQPRNSSNQFAGGLQNNNMISLDVGLRKKLNEVSAMFLTFTTVRASSNNTFERYLPYNYTGQSISLGYQLSY